VAAAGLAEEGRRGGRRCVVRRWPAVRHDTRR
jgi:hypothetical protein